jgi:hypothetical protein
LKAVRRESAAHLKEMLEKFHEVPHFEKSPVVVPPTFVSSSVKDSDHSPLLKRESFKFSTSNLPMERLLRDGMSIVVIICINRALTRFTMSRAH